MLPCYHTNYTRLIYEYASLQPIIPIQPATSQHQFRSYSITHQSQSRLQSRYTRLDLDQSRRLVLCILCYASLVYEQTTSLIYLTRITRTRVRVRTYRYTRLQSLSLRVELELVYCTEPGYQYIQKLCVLYQTLFNLNLWSSVYAYYIYYIYVYYGIDAMRCGTIQQY